MCPAYDLRPQPLALMRSADRVLSKLDALEALTALLGVPISSIDRRVITSISADAPRTASFCRKRIGKLIARKPMKLAAVALANKMARIALALLTRGEV